MEKRPHLEPGHDGSVVRGVEEFLQRERLRRLAAPEERRAALVEVPRHLRVQLRAPGRHGGGAGAAAWEQNQEKRARLT